LTDGRTSETASRRGEGGASVIVFDFKQIGGAYYQMCF
jgi:hypothetical protein